jgi:hypothetical protein
VEEATATFGPSPGIPRADQTGIFRQSRPSLDTATVFSTFAARIFTARIFPALTSAATLFATRVFPAVAFTARIFPAFTAAFRRRRRSHWAGVLTK